MLVQLALHNALDERSHVVQEFNRQVSSSDDAKAPSPLYCQQGGLPAAQPPLLAGPGGNK